MQKLIWCCYFVVSMIAVCIQGKLELSYFPRSNVLYTHWKTGRGLFYCEVNSDRDFKLEWYKDGNMLLFNKKPPWPYPFADGSGKTLLLWPFINKKSDGEYECRATNGFDPPVSHKVRFSALKEDELPADFPKITKRLPAVTPGIKQYFGSNITLDCDATGGKYMQILWTLRYVPLHKKYSLASKEEEGFDYKLLNNNRTIHIYNLKKVINAFLTCHIANNIGTFEVGRYFIDTEPSPIISVLPKIYNPPKNITVNEPGTWVEFSCNATGSPQPLYSWNHDGRWVIRGSRKSTHSIVAMRTTYITCEAENQAGKDTSTAYIKVLTSLPFQASAIQPLTHTPTSFTIEIKPHHKEAEWHKDIPITHALIDYRPWYAKIGAFEPHKTRKVELDPNLPHGPWKYTWENLRPNTWIEMRIRLVNKYGIGKSSFWNHYNTAWTAITQPVENLRNIPHSNKSFTLKWENPKHMNGPVRRYEVYWTEDPSRPLEEWRMSGTDRKEQMLQMNWHGTASKLGDAPVIYWKVLIYGSIAGPPPHSETKVFRVCPGAPGFVTNVSAYPVSAVGIQVYWNETLQPGNGIIAHQIFFNRVDKPKDLKDWSFAVVKKKVGNTAIVNGLKPNREYRLVVFPQSKAMIGVPSHEVTATTFQAAPSGPPLNVQAIARSSETIEMIWSPPDVEKQNAPITSYKIYYTRKSGRQPIIKVVDRSANRFLLQGLGKYTKYKVWMYAVNAKGESPKSAVFNIVTREEVSEGAPRSVRAFALNDTAIAITWIPPDGLVSGSRILGYKIYIREIYDFGDAQQEHVLDVRGADTKDAIYVKWIGAGSKFRFYVAAFSNAGESERSNPIVAITPKKLPPSPNVLVNYDLTRNYLVLKWWPRTNQTDSFKIEYGKSLRKYDMLTMKKVKLVDSHIRTSAFDDLSPGVYYCFKVSAEFKDDEGWTAENVQWLKTSEGIPTGEPLYFEATTESSSTIRLKWEEPDPWKRNGEIKGYNIRYKSEKDFAWKKEIYKLLADEDSIVYLLSDLHANQRYSVKVSAFTAVGPGPYTEILQVKTNKEALPMVENLNNMDPKVDKTTSLSSVSIHWNKPANLKRFSDIPFQYKLAYGANKRYRNEYGKEEIVSFNDSVTVISEQYLINDLRAGFEYTISVKMILEGVGTGDAVEIVVKTPNQAPEEIISPFVNTSQPMTDHMPIYLSAASEIRGPINHYLLFVINMDKTAVLPASLKSEDFGTASPKHNQNNNHRKRRAIFSNSTRTIYNPDYNVAAFLQRTELPVLYKLGDGLKKDGYTNERLIPGNFYSTFLRAYVRQGNIYLFSDSKFSTPVRYVPTSPNVGIPNKNNVKSAGESTGSPVVLIAGSIAGVLAIIIIVVVAIIFCRRGTITAEKDRLLRNNSFRDKKSSDPAEMHRQNSNAPGLLKHPPIHVDNLAKEVELLKANGGAKYLQEFESIDPGEKPSAEASNLMQNRSKNRYPNVVSYDETRVKLDYNGILCSDYINANYIDGYCQQKAYIATQGPLKNTVDDFWRLCWEQNVQTIVMMTKVEERGRSKCEEYWPTKGFENYGNIKVELKEERVLCNYCVRTFIVTSTLNSDERTVKHFQYLQWPDPGVPENPGPVLSFMRRVRAHKPPACGPVLVHCSAGVGRSACFIAIDAMLERIKHDNMVDIYGYVTMMRTQRNFMVQTDEQYIFVYDVIVEAIECGNTEILFTDFASEFKKLCELNPNHGDTMLERQFKSIAYSQDYARIDASLMAISQSAVNDSKNRCRNVIPFDNNRVTLQPLRSHEGSDYINASYIDGYHRKNAFIATQGPLENTVADFWRMIVEQDCNLIVMLTSLEEKGKQLCAQYWPTTKTMRHHYYVIDPVNENRFANFIVREFKITDARVNKTHTVRQYHYLNWYQGKVPESIEGITEFIGHVQKGYDKYENDGPIVVHSSTGAGRTGVFIALSIALDSLRKDGYVDLYQVVKGLRYERSFMVQTVEQYEFCFKVLNDYLKSFDLVV